jgi:hypothetical protein
MSNNQRDVLSHTDGSAGHGSQHLCRQHAPQGPNTCMLCIASTSATAMLSARNVLCHWQQQRDQDKHTKINELRASRLAIRMHCTCSGCNAHMQCTSANCQNSSNLVQSKQCGHLPPIITHKHKKAQVCSVETTHAQRHSHTGAQATHQPHAQPCPRPSTGSCCACPPAS